MTPELAPSVGSRRPIVLAGTILALLVAAAVAVGLARGGEQTFDGSGVSFRFPDGWEPFPGASFAATGRELSRTVLGLDERNAVLVATYRLNTDITAASFATLKPEIVESIERLVADAGGRVLEGPADLTLDGMPALRFEVAIPADDGVRLTSRLVVAFRGDTEYWLNCRHDAEHAQEILDGCDLIVRTFDAG